MGHRPSKRAVGAEMTRHRQAGAPERSLSAAFEHMLCNHEWTFFVTLSSNDRARASRSSAPSFASAARADAFMRDRLRNWDARVNRALLGKHWLVRPDERIEAFGVLEKPASNAHWHLLVKMYCLHPKREFEVVAEEAWQALVATGSVDVQAVGSIVGLSRYLTKTMPYSLSSDRTVILPEISRKSCK